jgi:predicted nuclease of predicted toxin-antitoxin system
VRFLIDECLHTSLVGQAIAAGYAADHVARIGLGGTADWDLMPVILGGDYIFVTNNASDFRRLYRREDLHAGLVIIVPNVRPDLQQALFSYALAEIGALGDLVNQVIEVALDGEDVVVNRYALPEDEA